MKALIVTLLLLDTGDTIAPVLGLQRLLISNWGNLSVLPKFPNEFAAEVTLTTYMIMAVQIFFAVQIQRFNRKVWPITYFMIFCAIAIAAISTVFCIHIFIVQLNSVEGQKPWKYLAIIPSAASVAVDVATSVLLIMLLNDSKSGFLIRQTRHIVNRIVLFMMTRGILLTVVQTVYTVTYLAATNGKIWTLFRVIIAKVYVNTLLAMLNSRESMRNQKGNNALALSTSGISAVRGSTRDTHRATIDFAHSGLGSNVTDSFTTGQASGGEFSSHDHKREEAAAL